MKKANFQSKVKTLTFFLNWKNKITNLNEESIFLLFLTVVSLYSADNLILFSYAFLYLELYSFVLLILPAFQFYF